MNGKYIYIILWYTYLCVRVCVRERVREKEREEINKY
jgi:hypothetical protein